MPHGSIIRASKYTPVSKISWGLPLAKSSSWKKSGFIVGKIGPEFRVEEGIKFPMPTVTPIYDAAQTPSPQATTFPQIVWQIPEIIRKGMIPNMEWWYFHSRTDPREGGEIVTYSTISPEKKEDLFWGVSHREELKDVEEKIYNLLLDKEVYSSLTLPPGRKKVVIPKAERILSTVSIKDITREIKDPKIRTRIQRKLNKLKKLLIKHNEVLETYRKTCPYFLPEVLRGKTIGDLTVVFSALRSHPATTKEEQEYGYFPPAWWVSIHLPNHMELRGRLRYSHNEYQASTEKCDVHMGPNYITFLPEKNVYVIHVEGRLEVTKGKAKGPTEEEVKLDITLRPKGKGILFGPDANIFRDENDTHWLRYVVPVPRGEILKGKITTGTRVYEFKGDAYHDGNRSNVSAERVTLKWGWGNVLSPEASFIFAETWPRGWYGGGEKGIKFNLLGISSKWGPNRGYVSNGQVLKVSSDNFKTTWIQGTKYTYPTTIRIKGPKINLKCEMKKILDYEAFLTTCPKLLKPLVKAAFGDLKYIRLLMSMEGNIGWRKIKEEGVFYEWLDFGLLFQKAEKFLYDIFKGVN